MEDNLVWYRSGKLEQQDYLITKRPMSKYCAGRLYGRLKDWTHEMVDGLDPHFRVCKYHCGYVVKIETQGVLK